MKLSIVLATYNRASLLERSISWGYMRQTMPLSDFEIIVLDDDSTDHTLKVCNQARSNGLNLTYVRLHMPEGMKWRDASSILNQGIRLASGELILLTHPEVIPGEEVLQACYDASADNVYVCAKPFYLTVDQQKRIDHALIWDRNVDYPNVRKDKYSLFDLITATSCYDFWNAPSAEYNKLPEYQHRNIYKAQRWDSWVFGGLTRATWKRIGGLSEHIEWGTVDVTFLRRRQVLGIANHTLTSNDNQFVYHQNHDHEELPPPRSNEFVKTMKPVKTVEDAVLGNLEGWV